MTSNVASAEWSSTTSHSQSSPTAPASTAVSRVRIASRFEASLKAGVMIESISASPAEGADQRGHHAVLLLLGHLVEERQDHCRGLRLLAPRERTRRPPRPRGVR